MRVPVPFKFSSTSPRTGLRRWLFRLACLVVLVIAISIAMVLPLRWFNPAVSAFMLADDSGREPLLHEWRDASQLGDAAALAVIAAEDQRFADHFGVDVASIHDAIQSGKDGGRLRGASTISQQVAKNLFLWNGRSYLRKGIEAYLTIVIEICLPKRRILEIYLNIAELGPGIYGFAAASQHYFDKPPSQLSDREAALLAATLPNPVRMQADNPTPYLREREAWILGEMRRLRRENWLFRLR